jgi:type II secretory pathway pseudopilin PulG
MKSRQSAAFTLIETVVALAMVMVVLGAMTVVLRNASRINAQGASYSVMNGLADEYAGMVQSLIRASDPDVLAVGTSAQAFVLVGDYAANTQTITGVRFCPTPVSVQCDGPVAVRQSGQSTVSQVQLDLPGADGELVASSERLLMQGENPPDIAVRSFLTRGITAVSLDTDLSDWSGYIRTASLRRVGTERIYTLDGVQPLTAGAQAALPVTFELVVTIQPFLAQSDQVRRIYTLSSL